MLVVIGSSGGLWFKKWSPKAALHQLYWCCNNSWFTWRKTLILAINFLKIFILAIVVCVLQLNRYLCWAFFVFLFCRPHSSVLFLIWPETNRANFSEQKSGSIYQKDMSKHTYSIHWCMSSHSILGVISPGEVWKPLFGQMTMGLSLTIRARASDFSWQWSFWKVVVISLCMRETERGRDNSIVYFYFIAMTVYGRLASRSSLLAHIDHWSNVALVTFYFRINWVSAVALQPV